MKANSSKSEVGSFRTWKRENAFSAGNPGSKKPKGRSYQNFQLELPVMPDQLEISAVGGDKPRHASAPFKQSGHRNASRGACAEQAFCPRESSLEPAPIPTSSFPWASGRGDFSPMPEENPAPRLGLHHAITPPEPPRTFGSSQ
jgi:hypothetical protein